MADQSNGEGWWVASDGKWYPPELHADFVRPAAVDPVVEPATEAAVEPEPEPVADSEPEADPEPEAEKFLPEEGENMVDWALDLAGVPGAGKQGAHAAEPKPPKPLLKSVWEWALIAVIVFIAGASILSDDNDSRSTTPRTTTVVRTPTPDAAPSVDLVAQDDIDWIAAQLSYQTPAFQNSTESAARDLAAATGGLVRSAGGNADSFLLAATAVMSDEIELYGLEAVFDDLGVTVSPGDCTAEFERLS